MKYFAADWHIGEDRIGINGKPNVFYRPFDSIEEQHNTIIDNIKSSNFKDGEDEFWNLGDVLVDLEYEFILKEIRNLYPNSKFNLIIGNYDEDKLKILQKYFDNIYTDEVLIINNRFYYLNHYPIKCKEYINKSPMKNMFGIVGHIHAAWKFQKNMINVGCDASHFKLISENDIIFMTNACEKYYDKNVFPY